VSVGYLNNFYRSHLHPIQTAIALGWYRIISGYEDQAVGLIQIHTQLTLPVTSQFMTPCRRNSLNIRKISGCLQLQ
jgi:hypothetical protein